MNVVQTKDERIILIVQYEHRNCVLRHQLRSVLNIHGIFHRQHGTCIHNRCAKTMFSCFDLPKHYRLQWLFDSNTLSANHAM